MTDYDFDPDLRPLLPLLPTLSDLSTLDKIREIREMRMGMFGEPEDRDDIVKEDRSVPGPEGAPDVDIRIYRPKAAHEGPRPCVFEIHGHKKR